MTGAIEQLFALIPESADPSTDPKVTSRRAETRHRLERVRRAKMVYVYGPGPTETTCASCVSLIRVRPGRGTYLKCRLYGVSRCEATDWRAKWPACGAYTVRP